MLGFFVVALNGEEPNAQKKKGENMINDVKVLLNQGETLIFYLKASLPYFFLQFSYSPTNIMFGGVKNPDMVLGSATLNIA